MWETTTVLEFLAAIALIIFVCTIVVWNIKARKRVNVNREHYRTQVHKSAKNAIEADAVEDPIMALLLLERSQTRLQTTADLAGGMDTLTILAGLDTQHLMNTLTCQERQVRAYAKQSMKPHPLSGLCEEPSNNLVSLT